MMTFIATTLPPAYRRAPFDSSQSAPLFSTDGNNPLYAFSAGPSAITTTAPTDRNFFRKSLSQAIRLPPVTRFDEMAIVGRFCEAAFLLGISPTRRVGLQQIVAIVELPEVPITQYSPPAPTSPSYPRHRKLNTAPKPCRQNRSNSAVVFRRNVSQTVARHNANTARPSCFLHKLA